MKKQTVLFVIISVICVTMMPPLKNVSLASSFTPDILDDSVLPNIPTVESDHPYENNLDKFWIIENNSGKSAARIYFSRIELEDGVDKIEIRDASDTLIQEISASITDGLWTDPVPGAQVKIVLKSDGSGRAWGFQVDRMEPLDYTTVSYSPHPYANDSTAEVTLVNSTPNPAGTRVHFSRIELEENVDYVIIKDINDVPYQWVTGSFPEGLTSNAVPGSGIKVQLVSDGSVREWGYNIAEIQTASPIAPQQPPLRAVTLAESDHPYPPSVDQVWTITNLDVAAKSSKVHFSRVAIESGDLLQMLDSQDTVVQTFTNVDQEDFWSDYVPGRVVKFRLVTTFSYHHWGFRVDDITTAVDKPGLAQSDHPYPPSEDQVWTITNPDVAAKSSKVHFSRVAIESGDFLQVLDSQDTVVQSFTNIDQEDFWSDYVPGRVVKLRLVTTFSYHHWGFRIDDIYPTTDDRKTPSEISGLYLTLVRQGVVYMNGVQISDTLQPGIYKVLLSTLDEQTLRIDYGDSNQLIRISLTTGGGFRISYLPEGSVARFDSLTLATVDRVNLQTTRPATIYVDGVEYMTANVAGEYAIPISSETDSVISLTYLDDTQTVQVISDDGSDTQLLYLPIITR